MGGGREEILAALAPPLRALPYFSPSCQGTTGLLANLDFSIDGRPLSSCRRAAAARGGRRVQPRSQAAPASGGVRVVLGPQSCGWDTERPASPPCPGECLPPTPASPGREPWETQPLPPRPAPAARLGSCRSWGTCRLLRLPPGSVCVTWALPTHLPRPLPPFLHPPSQILTADGPPVHRTLGQAAYRNVGEVHVYLPPACQHTLLPLIIYMWGNRGTATAI